MKTKKQVSNILGVLWADETTITLYLSDGEANILGRVVVGRGGEGVWSDHGQSKILKRHSIGAAV